MKKRLVVILSLLVFATKGWGWEIQRQCTFPTNFYDMSVVGDDAWAVGENGAVVHSEDGGMHYDFVSNPALNTTTNTYIDLWSVSFYDQMHGLAGGDEGFLIRTTDGGQTWQDLTSAVVPYFKNTAGDTLRMRGIVYLSTGQVWICSSNGKVAYSADHGATWSAQNSGVTTTINDICMNGAGTGYMACSRNSTATQLLKTTDFGTTWTLLPGLTANTSLYTVRQFNEQVAWQTNFSAPLASDNKLSGDAFYDPGHFVTLTPADFNKHGRLFLTKPFLMDQFTVDFDFLIDNGSGADGLTFAFVRDANYPQTLGEDLNFSGAEGYAVEFDTHPNTHDPSEEHIALIQNSASNHLSSWVATDGELENSGWHHATIQFQNGHVQVFLGGVKRLDYQIADYKSFSGYFGFTAATGGSTNNHCIDNINLRVGNNGLVFTGEKGYVGFSPDNGATLTNHPGVGGAEAMFGGVTMSGATGYAFGNYGIVVKTEDNWQTARQVANNFPDWFEDSGRNSSGHLVTCAWRGNLAHSQNGANWTDTTVPAPDFFGGSMVSEEMWYLAGQLGALYKTTDGGAHFELLSIPEFKRNFRAVHFFDAHTGLVTGEAQGRIFRTTDGGHSWATLQVPGATGANDHLYDFSFPSAHVGYVAGKAGKSAKTTDGGLTWTAMSGLNSEIRTIGFVNESVGFGGGAAGKLYVTTDGGTSWTAITVGSADFRDIYFKDAKHGVVTQRNGFIYYTKTGGLTENDWQPAIATSADDVNGVTIDYYGNVWAAGLSSNPGQAGGDNAIHLSVNDGTNWKAEVLPNLTLNPTRFNGIMSYNDRVVAFGGYNVIYSHTSKSRATLTHGPLVGGVTDSHAAFVLRASMEANLQIEVSEQADFSHSMLTEAFHTVTDSNFFGKVAIHHLAPKTKYYYRAVIDGQPVTHDARSFETFAPAGEVSDFTFLAASCQQNPLRTDGGKIFAVMAQDDPKFFLQMGDWAYPDAYTTQAPGPHGPYNFSDYKHVQGDYGYEWRYDPNYGAKDLLNKTSVSWVWDDHDMGRNDPGYDFPGIPLMLRGYQAMFPHYELPNPEQGIWHKISYGNVDVFFTDNRAGRDPNTRAFKYVDSNPAKDIEAFAPGDKHDILAGEYLNNPTTPGEDQMTWLLHALAESNADWKFIATGTPFNPGIRAVMELAIHNQFIADRDTIVRPSGAVAMKAYATQLCDKWAGFPLSIDKLVRHIADNRIENVMMLTGDIHGAAIDDGANSILPEMAAGPMDERNLEPIITYEALGVNIFNKGGQVTGVGAADNGRAYGRVQIFGADSVALEVVSDKGNVIGRHAVKNGFLPARVGGTVVPTAPYVMNFGKVKMGQRGTDHIIIVSTSVDPLAVTGIDSDNPAFSVAEQVFNIAPGDDKKIAVYFNPTTAGVATGTITIRTNDPDNNGRFIVKVRGEGVPVAVTHGPFAGGVTHQSARFVLRAESQATLAVELAKTPDFAQPLLSKTLTVEAAKDFFGLVDAENLEPSTTYYYRAVSNGTPSATVRRFSTFPTPGADTNFKFLFGSCQQGDPRYFTNGLIFKTMAGLDGNAAFFLQQGDWSYPDSTDASATCNDPPFDLACDYFPLNYSRVQNSYKSRYSHTYDMVNLLSLMPVDYTWDDHDFVNNNSDGDYPGAANSLKGYGEMFPAYPLSSPNGIWHKFTYGNTDVFMVDNRAQRDPNPDAFITLPNGKLFFQPDADHSILGEEQMAWLLDELAKSTADWKFISTGVPFNPGFRAAIDLTVAVQGQPGFDPLVTPLGTFPMAYMALEFADKWAGFPKDVQRLVAHVRSHNVQNVIFLSGDMHTAGIDDGANAIFPEIMAGPLETELFPVLLLAQDFGLNMFNRGGHTTPQSLSFNYGRISVAGADSVTLELVNIQGQVAAKHTVKAGFLPNGVAGTMAPGGFEFGEVAPISTWGAPMILASAGADTLRINGITSTDPQHFFALRLTPSGLAPYDGSLIKVAPGENAYLYAAFVSNEPNKEYQGALIVHTNDPQSPFIYGMHVKTGDIVGVEEDPTARTFDLAQNMPNPFRGSTAIQYSLPQSGHVTINIYNVAGQKVKTLVDASENAGSHEITWDGRNDRNETVSQGIYFYSIRAGENNATRRMILMR